MSTPLILLAGAHLLALVSPGPDSLLMLQTTLRHGRAGALRCAAGIALGNAAWIMLATLGLAELVQQRWLFDALQLIGAGLLLLIGWHSLRQPTLAEAAPVDSAAGRHLLVGLASACGNPKNGLFYLGLFAFGLAPDTPVPARWLLAVWMVAAVFGWNALLAVLLDRECWRRRLHGLVRPSGALLLVAGLALLVPLVPLVAKLAA
ncbi:LysE family transporter [Neisseriaceae bacterium JH1-16]|nr:LysE family transporter [Neisseriaceae bacterium JH1-16]